MQQKKSILLIHPPVSKPSEPPPGLAKLAGALPKENIDLRIYDANLAGILDLLQSDITVNDTWTKRAVKHVEKNKKGLRSFATYACVDRYKRAATDINRVIQAVGHNFKTDVSLSNYTSSALSPVRSRDLLQAAEQFDRNPFYCSFQKRLEALFSESQPALIGLSVNFMSQALCAFAMAGFIKKLLPHARIVMGGGLVTSWMNIPGFKNPFSGLIGELVKGPGEDFLLGACDAAGSVSSGVSGYDYSQFKMDQYLSPMPVIPCSTARGCYWQKCTFCPEKSEKIGYYPLNPSDACRDIQGMFNSKTAGLVHFTDNALSPTFLNHVIKNPLEIPWYGFVRITHHLADPDFAAGLKQSGCVMLKLGVESGDQAVLDSLEKGMDLNTASSALQNLKQAGIATYVYLLFGTPAEDAAGAEKTLEFTLAHIHAIDFLNLAIFNLPATSEDAGGLETVEFYRGDLSLYRAFRHPKGWNRDKVRQFLARSFKRHPAIKPILNNDPPFFTSNHASFISMAKGHEA